MDDENIHKEIRDELQNLSPFLASKLNKQKSWPAPINYFDTLPDKVLNKMSMDPQSITKSKIVALPFYRNKSFKIWLAAASITAMILITSVLWMKKSPPVNVDFDSVSYNEAKAYLLKNAADISDEQLSLLPQNLSHSDILQLTDDELQPVLDDYLYQIQMDQLN
ncbi:MAG: hypothetical protein ABI844_04960 [Saprospiraceae bacterium]